MSRTNKIFRNQLIALVVVTFILLSLQVMAGTNEGSIDSEQKKIYVYPDYPKEIPTYRKLHSSLSNFLDIYYERGFEAASEFAGYNCIYLKDRNVKVDLLMMPDRLPGEIPEATLKKSGAIIDAQSEHFMTLYVPIENLAQLSEALKIVCMLHSPIKPIQTVVSEGFELVGGEPFHDAGITGEGVSVAVMDFGYSFLADRQNEGELPENFVERDYTGQGIGWGGTHGTRCAEILFDFVPDAEFWLVKIGGWAHVENAMNDLANNGVDIVSMSFGYFAPFSVSYFLGDDPLSMATNRAFENGTLPVIAAGNNALQHYRGIFDNRDQGNSHHFGEDNGMWLGTMNHFMLNQEPRWLNNGDFIGIFLYWDDFPRTDQDYALMAWRWDGAQWVWVATANNNLQAQGGGIYPGEFMEGNIQIAGYYAISVVSVDVDRVMDFTLWTSSTLFYSTPEGSILTPGRASEAITVGAIDHNIWQDDHDEPIFYSGRGPTYAGVMKPDICGPTNVSTATGALGGTSCATPHVAGAAGLILSENPDMTAGDLREYLATHAIDQGPEGFDNLFGHGKVNIELGEPQPRDLTVPLNVNWNMISINVTPPEEMWEREEGPDVILMTEQLRIDEENHHLLLMKNEDGLFYLPAFGFNNIPYWDLIEGYLIKVDEDIQACWSGEPIPADADIPLERDWNLVAYYPTYELDASVPDYYVLSPIIDNVMIAKDGDGNFMLPSFDFSNMPPWRETQGYQVRVDEDVVLNYPEEQDENAALTPHSQLDWESRKTSENMSVLITSISGIEINQNDQIVAYNSNGRIVGVGTIDTDGRCGIAVWGDETQTEKIDGLLEGEAFKLKLWNAEREIEADLAVESLQSGQGLTYSTDSYIVLDVSVDVTIPKDFFLSNIYPNPFNSTTMITYGLPVASNVSLKLYELSGRMIQTLVDGERQEGIQTTILSADDLPSGLYFIRLSASGHVFTRKVMLVR